METNGRRELKVGSGNKRKEEVESRGWKHMEGGG